MKSVERKMVSVKGKWKVLKGKWKVLKAANSLDLSCHETTNITLQLIVTFLSFSFHVVQLE